MLTNAQKTVLINLKLSWNLLINYIDLVLFYSYFKIDTIQNYIYIKYNWNYSVFT